MMTLFAVIIGWKSKSLAFDPALSQRRKAGMKN